MINKFTVVNTIRAVGVTSEVADQVRSELWCRLEKKFKKSRKPKSMPFLIFRRDHLRSTSGIICGSGSFAVRFGDHFRSGDHLRRCTVLTVQNTCVPSGLIDRTTKDGGLPLMGSCLCFYLLAFVFHFFGLCFFLFHFFCCCCFWFCFSVFAFHFFFFLLCFVLICCCCFFFFFNKTLKKEKKMRWKTKQNKQKTKK